MINVLLNSGARISVPENVTMEIERSSPFFSSNDEWVGERSTPITIPYTKNNALSLGYPFNFYTKRIKKIDDADLYDGTVYRQRGKLITESGLIDQNHLERSELRGYFVFALSNFYQTIKDKKLRSLSMGGKRSFNWTTNNPNDNSGGFWQYVHGTWDGAKDFLVAPIRNDDFDEPTVIDLPIGNDVVIPCDWMNRLGDDRKLNYNLNLFQDTLCPQIHIKYLIEQIFKEHGYTVEFDVGDEQWEKMFMVSLIPFNWVNYSVTNDWPAIAANPKPLIDVYLNEHLPDKTISDFIFHFGNRYGWRFLVNDNLKICRVKSKRNILKGTVKDWTKYMASSFETDSSEAEKVIAFKNEIDGGDSMPLTPEFEGKVKLGDYYSFIDLPAANGVNYGQYAYTFVENSYWIVSKDDNNQTYFWSFFGDNVFNYEPTNATDTISTTVSTLPVSRVIYLNISNTDYFGIFPVMKQRKLTDFGFRTLFYYGMVDDVLANGNAGGGEYPHLTCLHFAPGDVPDALWSNIYVHDFNNQKRGIIDYWFKDWVDILKQGETIKLMMNLPRQDLFAFEWDNIILLKNIPFLVKGIVEPVPYKNMVEVTLHRIG
jgi:hypothetical protein